MTKTYKTRESMWKDYDGSTIEMITGAILVLNPNCEYSRKRFVYQKSEVPEMLFMQKIVRSGDVVLDIGATVCQ